MSDGVLITLMIVGLVGFLAYIFRRPIGERIGVGGVDTGVQFPLGGKIWATLSPAEKKETVAQELHISETAAEQLALPPPVPEIPDPPKVGWKRHKVANLYWLASDTISTLSIMGRGRDLDIIHGLGQCLWHVEELGFDDVI